MDREGREYHCKRKKAQAAMEFLMTYGWAIIVVMIAMGFLVYFGVLSTDSFLPSMCTLPAGLSCVDYVVETTQITFVLHNNLGSTITIYSLTVTQQDGNSCSLADPLTMENDEKAVVIIQGCGNGVSGSRFKGSIDLAYSKQDLLPHTLRGDITTRVGGAGTSTSNAICQNAEDNGLCGGLDIAYGTGYQAACCSEHNLCC